MIFQKDLKSNRIL